MTFLLTIAIYLAKKTQIALLIIKKVQISSEYSDFLNVFLEKKVLVLSTAINLNKHVIKLQEN